MNSLLIPDALKARNQWLVWKLEDRSGKPSKVPYCVKTGRLGKSNDPASWCDFDAALKAALDGQGYDGVGFAFHEGDELAGVDVDYPWDNPIATEIRERFKGTYCEKSPSGKLRLFCYGKPRRCGKGNSDKAIEVYDHTSPRYLTVTGEWIEGTAREVTEQQAALDWLHKTYFKPKEKPETQWQPQACRSSLSVSDQEVIDKTKAARNGGKFSTLFYGGWEAVGYPSQSEADAALCSMLAFWTQDAGQIDGIFRQSALMRPKWDKRHHADGRTYGQATIERALGAVTETYRAGFIEAGPSPWEDPPVESYADDPESREQDRDSGTRYGDSGDSGEKVHEDSFSGWRLRGDWRRLFLERAKAILLSNSYEPQDYPIHALGPLSEVCAGVTERGQMTAAMAGQCVLGAAALLCQSRANVQTLAGVKPLLLNLLTIGESGDGKTTGEEIALKPVIGYQRKATKKFKQALSDYEEALARRKKGDPLPEKPREPYLIMKDGTVEGIRRSFAEGLPSQGVFTSEAAVLLSGYGMRRENQAKTAAEFNHLWDHGEISVSRSTAGRIQLYDRRLSLHWMLQPEAAYEGLHNPLLSKMGFWPRFLFAWPPPSQPRKAIPFRSEQDSRIREYWERCQALLDYPLGEDCADLPILEATPEAEGLACRFFEQMEGAAKSKDGILRDARAFALRATELVFRVAGVLVIFQARDRLRAHIDLEFMRNGIELVAYSLETWRAAHGDRHETEMRSDAFRLYEWLLNQPQASVLETSILHIGPRATRSQSRRDTALSLLQQAKLVFCEGRTWKAKIE